MTFWIAVGFISFVVASLVALAALRPGAQQAPTAAYDLQVYRDQLRELDKDVARGTLSEEEASRARTEVSRRILDADRALQEGGTAASTSRLTLPLVGVGLIATLAGSVWTYSIIGAPGYPDLPIAGRVAMIEEARANRPSQDVAEERVPASPPLNVDPERVEMVVQLRTVLERRPDDTQGLTLLAANEAMLGNYIAARRAQQRLIMLMGDEATGRHHIDHAEMMIFAAGGYISPEAEMALRQGLSLEPNDGTGRYYAGEMYAQQGRPDLALPIWANLLRTSDPSAPWVPAIRNQIADVAFRAGVELDPALTAAPRAPRPSEMEGLSPNEQQEMIAQMVSGLADRLSTEGGPPEDWAQLITAYGVLGRVNAAQIVYEDALETFAEFPEAIDTVESAFTAAMARLGTSAPDGE